MRESHCCATGVKDNASLDPEVGALKGDNVRFSDKPSIVLACHDVPLA